MYFVTCLHFFPSSFNKGQMLKCEYSLLYSIPSSNLRKSRWFIMINIRPSFVKYHTAVFFSITLCSNSNNPYILLHFNNYKIIFKNYFFLCLFMGIFFYILFCLGFLLCVCFLFIFFIIFFWRGGGNTYQVSWTSDLSWFSAETGEVLSVS